MKMKWFLLLFPAAISFAQSANKCADLARFQMPGANIEISRAEMVRRTGARGTRRAGADAVRLIAAWTESSTSAPDRKGRPTASGSRWRCRITGIAIFSSRAAAA